MTTNTIENELDVTLEEVRDSYYSSLGIDGWLPSREEVEHIDSAVWRMALDNMDSGVTPLSLYDRSDDEIEDIIDSALNMRVSDATISEITGMNYVAKSDEAGVLQIKPGSEARSYGVNETVEQNGSATVYKVDGEHALAMYDVGQGKQATYLTNNDVRRILETEKAKTGEWDAEALKNALSATGEEDGLLKIHVDLSKCSEDTQVFIQQKIYHNDIGLRSTDAVKFKSGYIDIYLAVKGAQNREMAEARLTDAIDNLMTQAPTYG